MLSECVLAFCLDMRGTCSQALDNMIELLFDVKYPRVTLADLLVTDETVCLACICAQFPEVLMLSIITCS
jgi:hypothetical protein